MILQERVEGLSLYPRAEMSPKTTSHGKGI